MTCNRDGGNWRGWVRNLSILMGIALIPALASAYRHGWTKTIEDDIEINLSAALRLGSNCLWLDGRPAKAYNSSHVPGALPLTHALWNDQLGAVLAKWTPDTVIVIYCDRTGCETARSLAQRLRMELNYTRIYSLSGGWDEWRKIKKT